MTEHTNIRKLKTLAKRYARAERIAQSKALDLVASHLGFSHWNALRAAEKEGWLPGPDQLAAVYQWVEQVHPYLDAAFSKDCGTEIPGRFIENAEEGALRGHLYRIQNALDDVMMTGDGWTIRVYEAPGKSPSCEVEEHKADGNPLFDDEFRAEALALASSYARKIRARISVDWDRRCTLPASNGTVRHPLGKGESDTWFCLHCDSKLTGHQLAKSLWHCPECGASPLDIFEEPFWHGDGGEDMENTAASGDENTAKTPAVEIVETKLRLELNQANVSLLIRTALLEEAANTSERLGALCAEIVLDDDGEISITLDEDLWPEGKDVILAKAVATELGSELEVFCTSMTVPFAWPSLGEFSSNAAEYTSMLLAAYREHGKIVR